jgi:hypothetical protein
MAAAPTCSSLPASCAPSTSEIGSSYASCAPQRCQLIVDRARVTQLNAGCVQHGRYCSTSVDHLLQRQRCAGERLATQLRLERIGDQCLARDRFQQRQV